MLLTPELEQMSTAPSASIKASAGREQPEQPVRALARLFLCQFFTRSATQDRCGPRRQLGLSDGAWVLNRPFT